MYEAWSHSSGVDTLSCLRRLQDRLQWLDSRAIRNLCKCKALLLPDRPNEPIDLDLFVFQGAWSIRFASLEDLRTSQSSNSRMQRRVRAESGDRRGEGPPPCVHG